MGDGEGEGGTRIYGIESLLCEHSISGRLCMITGFPA